MNWSAYAVSTDSRWVVYTVADPALDRRDLYSVGLYHGAPIALNTAEHNLAGFEIAASSDRVVFLGEMDDQGQHDLFSIAIDNGDRVRLNDQGQSVEEFVVGPDGRALAYTAGEDLFGVPIAGGTPLLLNPGLDAGPREMAFADASTVLFAVGGSTDHVYASSMEPDANADGVIVPCDNCRHVGNAAQSNTDGDMGGDECDCAATDNALWSIPGVTGRLRLDHHGGPAGTTSLLWSAPALPGAESVA